MTEEEKAAIAAAGKEEEANAEAAAGEGGGAEAPGSSKIDYEALAKEEQTRANEAEAKLEETRTKAREASAARAKKREEAGLPAEEEEEKPLTASELDRRLDERDERRDKEAQKERALEIARANTTSEAEAQAAVLFYKNRIVPTGNLEEDVLFAIGGLNRKRIAGQQREIRRAEGSKETVSTDAAQAHQESPPLNEAKLPPNDAKAIQAAGMVWDGTLGLYKKALGRDGKKFLFFNPKTKQRFVK